MPAIVKYGAKMGKMRQMQTKEKAAGERRTILAVGERPIAVGLHPAARHVSIGPQVLLHPVLRL